MNVSIQKNDVFWAHVGQLTEIGSLAILTIFIAVILPSFEVGLWYVFMSFYSFALLFDTGFSPIMMRNTAFCMAGALMLTKTGVPEVDSNNAPNYNLIKALVSANRRLMCVISLGVFMLLMVIGIPYIIFVTGESFHLRYLIAWVIFISALSLDLIIRPFIGFIKGTGAIARAHQIVAVGRLMQLIICFSAFFSGWGILVLSTGYLIGSSLVGTLSLLWYRKHFHPLLPSKSTIKNRTIIESIWNNTWRLMAVGLGTYLTTQANTILCSTFLGLEITASYGLTVQGFLAVTTVSAVLFQVSVPSISKARSTRDSFAQIRLLSRSVKVYWILGILGGTVLLFFANPMLRLLNASTLILGFPVGLLIGIMFLLERNQSIFGGFITTSNYVPYVKASLITGTIIVILSTTAVAILGLGVIGLVMSQMLVQLTYNNWKWPAYVCKELEIKFIDLFKHGGTQNGNNL